MKFRKYIFLLLLFVCLFFKCNFVLADYVCSYDAYNTTGEFEVKPDENKIKLSPDSYDFLLDSYLLDNSTPADLINYLDGGCPDYVYVCKHLVTESIFIIDGVDVKTRYAFIINPDAYNNFTDSIKLDKDDKEGSQATYDTVISPSDCVIASINETKTTGSIKEGLFNCSYYNENFNLLKESYCTSNDNDCTNEKKQSYRNQNEKLTTWCNSVLQYADFVNPCVKACLGLKSQIEKEILNDKISNNETVCGFSERLADWGLNIMKWIKYIVPVFVIIFGIIDFIKAMSGDKEDEMKKSQKKFITRLIAAALIFIIPFIIEFVLDKFGFTEYIDGCGVITEME